MLRNIEIIVRMKSAFYSFDKTVSKINLLNGFTLYDIHIYIRDHLIFLFSIDNVKISFCSNMISII